MIDCISFLHVSHTVKFHEPPPAKIKRELSPLKEISPRHREKSPMPYEEKCPYSYRYLLAYTTATAEHCIGHHFLIQVIFDPCHPQCLRQDSHHWLQTIGSSLNTHLPSWLHKHWVDAPPCSQSNLWAASSKPTAASSCQHRITKPDGSLSWHPHSILCCALCPSQE